MICGKYIFSIYKREKLEMDCVKDKVSIIMGIYNCEDTLAESIDSIVNQTYDNWELILCDDASTDSTLEVALRYSKVNDKIRVIKNNENKGLAYSLNKCIEYADGEFIARHDGDDICYLNRIEKQVNFIKKKNCELVGSAAEFFDESGIWGTLKFDENPTERDVFNKSVFIHPTILMKRDILIKIGGYTVSKITFRTEDYDLFVKLYANGYKGINMNEVLLQVRRDSYAYKRKKFKYRIDESRCKYKAWKLLNQPIYAMPLIFLPIIKGVVPVRLLKVYHSIKLKTK